MEDIEDLCACAGFTRPEMNECELAGTVEALTEHVFIRVNTPPPSWPKAAHEGNSVASALVSGLKGLKDDLKVNGRKLRITLCHATSMAAPSPVEADGDGVDVLVFPWRALLRNVRVDHVGAVMEYISSKELGALVDLHTEVSGDTAYVFVCSHEQMDKRCGYCGPRLLEHLAAECESRGYNNLDAFEAANGANDLQGNSVLLFGVSHVGGHRYAGNVLVYPSGDWFGYVTPKHVPALLDIALCRDATERDALVSTVGKQWRGRLGWSKEQQKTFAAAF